MNISSFEKTNYEVSRLKGIIKEPMTLKGKKTAF